MFEYLMPNIIMPGYENSLLSQSCKTAVKRQIEYGKLRGVPWGISESDTIPLTFNKTTSIVLSGYPDLDLKEDCQKIW